MIERHCLWIITKVFWLYLVLSKLVQITHSFWCYSIGRTLLKNWKGPTWNGCYIETPKIWNICICLLSTRGWRNYINMTLERPCHARWLGICHGWWMIPLPHSPVFRSWHRSGGCPITIGLSVLTSRGFNLDCISIFLARIIGHATFCEFKLGSCCWRSRLTWMPSHRQQSGNRPDSLRYYLH